MSKDFEQLQDLGNALELLDDAKDIIGNIDGDEEALAKLWWGIKDVIDEIEAYKEGLK